MTLSQLSNLALLALLIAAPFVLSVAADKSQRIYEIERGQ